MAQFLALLRRDYERFTEADFAPLLDPEAERVRVLYAAGVIRQIYGRKDVPGAAIVLEAASFDEADTLIATLPLVARGMLEVQLLELGPYRGFMPAQPATSP